MYELDQPDKQILAILQEDGRTSNVSIAKRIGAKHTWVHDRIIRMEEAGIIERYEPLLIPSLKRGILCIVQL